MAGALDQVSIEIRRSSLQSGRHWGRSAFSIAQAFAFDSCSLVDDRVSPAPATLPLEVEYDNGVISQYPVQDVEVQPSGIVLRLGTKHTACLAPDRCGIDLTTIEQNPASSCCTPGCC